LFGTFAPEDEKIHFGLTHPVKSFDPLYLQLNHYRVLINRFKEIQGWRNKLSVLLKGPGWEPGKPRLGLLEDIPDVRGNMKVEYFHPDVPLSLQLYTVLHFVIMLFFHVRMMEGDLSHSVTLVLFSFIFTSLMSFGLIMEGHFYAERLELFRCWFFVFIEQLILPTSHLHSNLSTTIIGFSIKIVFFASLLVLMIRQLNRVGLLKKLTKEIQVRIK